MSKINPKYLDANYWAEIAEEAMHNFEIGEAYLVSEDVLEEFSKTFYPKDRKGPNGIKEGIPTISSFVSDAGELPVRVIKGKTNYLELVIEDKSEEKLSN